MDEDAAKRRVSGANLRIRLRVLEWRFESAMRRNGGLKPPMRDMALRREPLQFIAMDHVDARSQHKRTMSLMNWPQRKKRPRGE